MLTLLTVDKALADLSQLQFSARSYAYYQNGVDLTGQVELAHCEVSIRQELEYPALYSVQVVAPQLHAFIEQPEWTQSLLMELAEETPTTVTLQAIGKPCGLTLRTCGQKIQGLVLHLNLFVDVVLG